MKHENDEYLKKQTCPACGDHLPTNGGLNLAHFSVPPEQQNSLNGLRPDAVLELCGTAIAFWASQERTVADVHRRHVKKLEERKEQMKHQILQAQTEWQQEYERLRSEKNVSDARCKDLEHELQLVNEKYQEETHKVRALQERMIDVKRRRCGSGLDSPVRQDGSATPERPPSASDLSRASRSPLRPPTHVGGSGAPMMAPRPLGGIVAAPRLPAPLSSPAHMRGGSGGLGGGVLGGGLSGGSGLGGGLGGGGLGGGGGSVRRGGQYVATPLGSRLATPVHRSATYMSPPSLAGGGLGGSALGGWGAGRR